MNLNKLDLDLDLDYGIDQIINRVAKETQPTDEQVVAYFENNVLGELYQNISSLKRGDVYVAGGSILSFINKRTMRDIDLFFVSQEAYDSVVEYIKTTSYGMFTEITPNATHVTVANGLDIDLVFHSFMPMEDMITTFDFTVCKFATDGQRMVQHYIARYHAFQKVLSIHNYDTPITTTKRVIRYASKGYKFKNNHDFYELINKVQLAPRIKSDKGTLLFDVSSIENDDYTDTYFEDEENNYDEVDTDIPY